MSSDEFKLVEELLAHFLGRECLSALSGGAAGTALSLGFPPVTKARTPLTNPHLTEEQRNFEPLLSLFISCSWRLDCSESVLFGCWSDELIEGTNLELLEQLVGRRIESFHLAAPGMDLDLRFSGDLSLRIFCDQVNRTDQTDNYSIFFHQKIVTVNTMSVVSVSDRAL